MYDGAAALALGSVGGMEGGGVGWSSHEREQLKEG